MPELGCCVLLWNFMSLRFFQKNWTFSIINWHILWVFPVKLYAGSPPHWMTGDLIKTYHWWKHICYINTKWVYETSCESDFPHEFITWYVCRLYIIMKVLRWGDQISIIQREKHLRSDFENSGEATKIQPPGTQPVHVFSYSWIMGSASIPITWQRIYPSQVTSKKFSRILFSTMQS